MIIEKQDFYFIRKPHHIPTTFGSQECFLEQIEKSSNPIFKTFIKKQSKEFSRDQEYGLCNRLDNETSGLLYFAKNQKIFEAFKLKQKNLEITKYYIADIKGKFFSNPRFHRQDGTKISEKNINSIICVSGKRTIIKYPLMHHIQIQDKMVTIKNNSDLSKGRGKQHQQSTIVEPLFYDPKKDHTTLLICIQKGIRHQIRCHLASIGYPIIGDKIYNKKIEDTKLHLRSIGLKFE